MWDAALLLRQVALLFAPCFAACPWDGFSYEDWEQCARMVKHRDRRRKRWHHVFFIRDTSVICILTRGKLGKSIVGGLRRSVRLEVARHLFSVQLCSCAAIIVTIRQVSVPSL